MAREKRGFTRKTEKLSDFRQLLAWEKAHELTLDIYKATTAFPAEERFGLTSQLRRAAYSVPLNIAEGFGRRSTKDKTRIYNIAQESLEEVKYGIILAGDLGYLENTDELQKKAAEAGRLLGALVRSNEKRKNS